VNVDVVVSAAPLDRDRQQRVRSEDGQSRAIAQL
jgi:hypothetical protein